ncbi:MAG: TPM domain-containing protein [Treponema sp.]|nr:TPM domain-containing protein [Treponema sp.]
MKTKLFLLSILFLFFLTLPVSIFAQRVFDNAGLLTNSQKETLQSLANSISEKYNFDLVIVTERSIGFEIPRSYAANFYDDNGFSSNGSLLLQITDTRDYEIIAAGRGSRITRNETAENKLHADTLRHLRANNYYQAYSAYLSTWEKFLELEAKGRSYNFFHQWNIILLSIAWFLSIAIGVIIVLGWRRAMDNAIARTNACEYVVAGSLVFKEKKDQFLYSTVTKTKRQSDSSSSGGSRGGFTSSSGGSFSGRGGRY